VARRKRRDRAPAAEVNKNSAAAAAALCACVRAVPFFRAREDERKEKSGDFFLYCDVCIVKKSWGAEKARA